MRIEHINIKDIIISRMIKIKLYAVVLKQKKKRMGKKIIPL